ncbi:MAG: hypothetical protein M0Z63_12430, partial [Actinomycetota bacterium]|nr:hypothetical protein [Actinomycetota bacterium]
WVPACTAAWVPARQPVSPAKAGGRYSAGAADEQASGRGLASSTAAVGSAATGRYRDGTRRGAAERAPGRRMDVHMRAVGDL